MKKWIVYSILLISLNMFAQDSASKAVKDKQDIPTQVYSASEINKFPTLFVPNQVSGKSKSTDTAKGGGGGSSGSYGGAIIRSIAFPGWGQHHVGSSGRGAMYNTIGVIGILAVIGSNVEYNEKKSAYNSYTPSLMSLLFYSNPQGNGFGIITETPHINSLRHSYDSSARTAQTVSIAVGAFWVWNILDVLIFGRSSSSSAKVESSGSLFNLAKVSDVNLNFNIQNRYSEVKNYNSANKENFYKMEFSKDF
ncbi:MAG: hypothetical protein IPO06_08180 [Leptospiraceae bacterium]|nr:hypothetical protein [Leptospiraceae bacterium]